MKDDDGELEGCHATREDAEAQMAALYAAEEDGDDDGDGDTEEDAAKTVTAAGEDQRFPFEGVAVVEGQRTGDGREFAQGSLTWPDPDEVIIPLEWQKETTHGGFNDVVVNVGRITSIERVGSEIRVQGFIDAGDEDGAEAVRRMSGDEENPPTLGGVSIVADDPEQADVELVFPDGCDEIDDKTQDEIESEVAWEDLEKCFMPEAVIFHSGRIRSLTLVNIPAFVEASIKLKTPDEEGDMTASATRTLGAVAVHNTATTDDPWDGPANESRLDSPMSVDSARAAYAWIDNEAVDDGEIAKANCSFIHHEVNDDGTPGAANLTACSSGIGILNGARGGTSVPRDDWQGIYDHLAAHLRDADREPPPPNFSIVDELESLVAASHIIQVPDVPPREWFSRPESLPPVGAITVTDEGRFYGLLAPGQVAHRSFPDKRVTVPKGNVDYSRWMNRETIVVNADGTTGRVESGAITMECGHASTAPWVGGEGAQSHYDNSCSIVATVRIGEDDRGVWVAGALLPDVTPGQVARILACQLSGDWRPHREKPGKRELAGALLVPVPGFPFSSRASLKLEQGELVAAAAPIHWLPSGDVHTHETQALEVQDDEAAVIEPSTTVASTEEPPAEEPSTEPPADQPNDDAQPGAEAQGGDVETASADEPEILGWEDVLARKAEREAATRQREEMMASLSEFAKTLELENA